MTKENVDPDIVVKKTTKDEMVEIKKSDFNRLMAQLEKQSKDIDLLYKAADKGRMSVELNKEGNNLIRQVRVWTWDNTGKNIIGCKLITDRCEVVMGKWIEEQFVSIVLEDGEVVEKVSLLEFYRKTLNKVPTDLLSKTEEFDETTKVKTVMYKVQFPTGKTLVINSLFVN